MKGDDYLGGASFTVQDIINAQGDEVAMELVLREGLCKDKGEATVSLSARFTANSGRFWGEDVLLLRGCVLLLRGCVLL